MANRKIIVIDDDLEIWKAYQDVLAPELYELGSVNQKMTHLLNTFHGQKPEVDRKFDLSYVSQGEEGFNKIKDSLAQNDPFAVAFIDVRMPPGWDGMETAARIREIDPAIEIVIITAFADRSRAEIVKNVGSPDKLLFLRKPFDYEEITQLALALTEKWNLNRQADIQRQELRTVLASTPVALITMDTECMVTSWNNAAHEITGYSADEMLGKTLNLRVIDDGTGTEVPLELKNIQEGTSEIILIRKNGTQRIVSQDITFARDDTGRHVKTVVSFWDITAMKEAGTALQASESRFRALVETTNDWVWEIDAQGYFTYCSPICEEIFGLKRDELLGKSLIDTLLPPAEQPRYVEFFAQCRKKKIGFKNMERQGIRKDGAVIHIESSASPVLNEEDEVIGFRGIDRDITARRKNEEEHLLLEEQIRQGQKMESIGTLAGGIAHDFNNILVPIISYTEMVLDEEPDGSQARKDLNEVLQAARRAKELVRQILAFSRKQIMLPEAINLNDLINKFIKMLRRLIREDVELDLCLADELWNIVGDTAQMEQVIINLTVNAQDAMPSGGTINIETRNEELDADRFFGEQKISQGAYVVFSVHDGGSGIDPDILNRIFDPFFTTKEAGKGTGLGLSTVYGIVSQHEGHILVDSSPDSGTSFSIYLPKPDRASIEEQVQAPPPIRGGKETILLAEDDPSVRLVMISVLERYGYRVLVAVDGSEAVQIINDFKGPIDLLLTDIVMPGLSGEKVAETFWAQRPNLAVVFISGYPVHVDTVHLIEGENRAFLQKPFRPYELARKVRELLDRNIDPQPELEG